jgi:hypothetical protein
MLLAYGEVKENSVWVVRYISFRNTKTPIRPGTTVCYLPSSALHLAQASVRTFLSASFASGASPARIKP